MTTRTFALSKQLTRTCIAITLSVGLQACSANNSVTDDHSKSDTSAHTHSDANLHSHNFGNKSEMTLTATERCFTSNGLPDHETGTFPNRGNPNGIEPQNVKVCMPLNPVKQAVFTPIRGTVGIALNGVQFRPNTAGFWDPDGRRGQSPNGDRNWSLDIHGPPRKIRPRFQ